MRTENIYICDDCHNQSVFKSYKKARAASWALCKDYKTCYCPDCATAHRLGGAAVKKRLHKLTSEAHFEQLSLGEIGNE